MDKEFKRAGNRFAKTLPKRIKRLQDKRKKKFFYEYLVDSKFKEEFRNFIVEVEQKNCKCGVDFNGVKITGKVTKWWENVLAGKKGHVIKMQIEIME